MIMDNGKLPSDGEIKSRSEFLKKLDNFWYHNKWKVIGGAFIAAVLIVCIIQLALREKTDVSIMYCGAFSSSDEMCLDMKEAFSDNEPDEIGNNGVKFTVLEIYDEEFLKKNTQYQAITKTSLSQMYNLIMSGEYSVLILDRHIYEDLKNGQLPDGFFQKIDEVCGNVPDSQKFDETAIVFKKTPFYAAYAGTFGKISDDAVLCLGSKVGLSNMSGCNSEITDGAYNKSVTMFKAIVNYK